jgi:hypothetical protein
LWKYLCKLLVSLATLLILSSAQARADDFLEQVTYNSPQPPGSVIIRYGGLRGLLFDETESQILNLWHDKIKLTIDYDYSIWDVDVPYQSVANFTNDVRRGGRWWERAWYYSLAPEKGGAPYVRVIDMDTVALDFWFFQVNSKLKVKVKEFSFDLSSHSALSRTDFWRVRIKPQLTFGPPYGLRRAGLSLILEWHLRRRKCWEVEFYVRYRGEENISGGVEVSLLRW